MVKIIVNVLRVGIKFFTNNFYWILNIFKKILVNIQVKSTSSNLKILTWPKMSFHKSNQTQLEIFFQISLTIQLFVFLEIYLSKNWIEWCPSNHNPVNMQQVLLLNAIDNKRSNSIKVNEFSISCGYQQFFPKVKQK